MRSKCYDLYELRQLTESIYVLRQEMGILSKNSKEYKIASEQYEYLWKMRDELEEKIAGLCNDSDKNEYWVIQRLNLDFMESGFRSTLLFICRCGSIGRAIDL